MDFNTFWNLVFNMHYRFQNILKFQGMLKTMSSVSRSVETEFSKCIMDFNTFWNLVFNMHYRFQNILKFSKCFFKMFSTHFKHKNSPMVWTMLKTVLRTMSNISKCVENHIENFKAWVVLQKKAWRDLLKTYFTELIQLKYKLILWIKTMGCCGLACVVWLKSCEFSKRKSVLIVGNSSIMCLLQKCLNLTYL